MQQVCHGEEENEGDNKLVEFFQCGEKESTVVFEEHAGQDEIKRHSHISGELGKPIAVVIAYMKLHDEQDTYAFGKIYELDSRFLANVSLFGHVGA